MNFLDPILACPSCRFDPNSPALMGANLAIGFMLLILVTVLTGFLALIWKLARGERLAQSNEPGQQ